MNFLLPFAIFINYIYYSQVFVVAGYGVVPLDIGMGLVFIYYLKRHFWNGDKLLISYNSGLIYFGLFVIAVAVSLAYPLFDGSSRVLTQYLKSALHLYYVMLILVVVFSRPIDTNAWKNLIKIMLVLSIFINIFGVYQLFARVYDLPFAFLEFENVSYYSRAEGLESAVYTQSTIGYENFYRGTSVFSEPAGYAGFNAFILIFSLFPYFNRQKSFFKSKTFNIIIITLALMGLFLTFSLTAMMIISFLFTLAMVLNWRYLRRFIVYIAIFIPLIFISTDSLVENYTGISVFELFEARIEGVVETFFGSDKQITGESFYGRVDNAYFSYEIWKQSPLTGVGIGLYSEYNMDFNADFSDSTILSVLSNLGLIGFIAFNLIFAFGFYKAFIYFKNHHKYETEHEMDHTFYSSLIYIMMYLFSICYFSANLLSMHYLWLYLGIVFSFVHKRQMKTGKDIYEVSLFVKPLKESFQNNLKNFIKLKKIG